jgi:hypothetical protein
LPGSGDDETQWLISLYNAKLAEYIEKLGAAIWDHRRRSAGYGSVRYEVIKRAAGRGEACGVSNQEKAIEVDHILPLWHRCAGEPAALHWCGRPELSLRAARRPCPRRSHPPEDRSL